MQTITLKPGEELRVVCASGPTNTGTLGGGRKGRSERKTRKAQSGGKRGPNPFMKFAAKERKNIMSSNPGMPVTEVGKELGKRWRALSDAEKSKY